MRFAASLALWLALGQTAAQAPQDFRAAFKRGLQALAAGQLDAAQAAFTEAQRLEPKNPFVFFHLAGIHAQRREFREAIVDFRQAIERDPREPQFYFRLAALYIQLQRFHDAQKALQELLRIRPAYADAYLLLGRVAQEQGDHSFAEKHLRHYLKLRPGNPEGLSRLGTSLSAEEKYREAEPLLQQALKENPNLGGAHYTLGVLYSRRGRDLQAKSHLAAATRLLPESAKAHYELGNILVRLDDLAQAERSFRKALELDPGYVEAHYALGTLLGRTGRSEEASRVLREYEHLSRAALENRERTRRISAYFWEVKDLLEQDRLEEAEAKLAQILELEPQNDLAYYRLGQIFYLRHEYERALANARVALSQKEFEPTYYMLEAMCLERLERDAEAATAYGRLVSLVDYADAYLALGRLELQRGDTRKAVGHLRRAVALEPQNPEMRLALAEALEKAGEGAEGRKQRAEAEALRSKSSPR
ncbi:MAG TPA: tetratricopeptide repeat protein [Candidatus Acidoferrales bacterium]|nr:tetratricopeptide repeat protein [Candidatus Acidoferrales bacterium]